MFPHLLRRCLCQFPCSIYLQTPKKRKPLGLQRLRRGPDQVFVRSHNGTSERHRRRSQQWDPFPGREMEDSNDQIPSKVKHGLGRSSRRTGETLRAIRQHQVTWPPRVCPLAYRAEPLTEKSLSGRRASVVVARQNGCGSRCNSSDGSSAESLRGRSQRRLRKARGQRLGHPSHTEPGRDHRQRRSGIIAISPARISRTTSGRGRSSHGGRARPRTCARSGGPCSRLGARSHDVRRFGEGRTQSVKKLGGAAGRSLL